MQITSDYLNSHSSIQNNKKNTQRKSSLNYSSVNRSNSSNLSFEKGFLGSMFKKVFIDEEILNRHIGGDHAVKVCKEFEKDLISIAKDAKARLYIAYDFNDYGSEVLRITARKSGFKGALKNYTNSEGKLVNLNLVRGEAKSSEFLDFLKGDDVLETARRAIKNLEAKSKKCQNEYENIKNSKK